METKRTTSRVSSASFKSFAFVLACMPAFVPERKAEGSATAVVFVRSVSPVHTIDDGHGVTLRRNWRMQEVRDSCSTTEWRPSTGLRLESSERSERLLLATSTSLLPVACQKKRCQRRTSSIAGPRPEPHGGRDRPPNGCGGERGWWRAVVCTMGSTKKLVQSGTRIVRLSVQELTVRPWRCWSSRLLPFQANLLDRADSFKLVIAYVC